MIVSSAEPAVSILLAVHNGGRFLAEAIESVRSQTWSDWELIVVSNGSTDNTVAICKDKAAVDPRIRLFVTPDKGKNRAYNLAWSKARGRLVCFFAADDLLPPRSLAIRIASLQGAPDDAYSTCCLRTMSVDPQYDGLLFPRNSKEPNFSGGSLLFGRSLAERIFPLPENQPNEDTWAQLHLRAFGQNRHVPKALYIYRIHDGNSYGYGIAFDEKRAGYLRRMHAYRLFYAKHRDAGLSFVQQHVAPFVRGLDAADDGNVLRILRVRGLPVANKMVLVFYCSRKLYNMRYKYFRALSGGFSR